ncbi:MAG: hypothetical protein HY098_09145 [Nitrospinae bacterium]|nr:hypothetical protein [Nitrospinota bacterium]
MEGKIRMTAFLMKNNALRPYARPKTPMVYFLVVAVLVVAVLNARADNGGNYYWYESGVKKTLHMDHELVAEFGPASDEESAVKNAEPSASRVMIRGGAAIWRVVSPKSALKKSAAVNPKAGVSPVFREGGNPGGRIMSLPGNVIVFFKGDWSEQKVKGWAAAKNLEIADKLNIGKNVYVLKTVPGLESLNLANKLQESGEVEAAAPDWWRPAQRR